MKKLLQRTFLPLENGLKKILSNTSFILRDSISAEKD
jgi:hypothetical protein